MITGGSSLFKAGNNTHFAQMTEKSSATAGGTLGSFNVSTYSSGSPSDIAKAASLSYHLDVDGDGPFFKNVRSTKRRKKIKSKFARRTSDDDADADDISDVDEATREEKGNNDTKMRRLLNIHLAKKAETNARLPNLP